ncbi:type 1 glutamine amidotransferase [Aestuariispira insulae]|uniref:GMP synthase (Glutamine-hydrolysing) n=1 Tax=Aestuariispira insulae TaxID=1461337 RepID=A0A3D9HRL9_9PROT|nr:type 1 glutamine amidotransferase [Aestuariispira insulae]RED52138.1 GMP synthase (glutamine-hydrolysing) [Aestuariispira insulae]
MPRILIVEGDTPDLLDRAARHGLPGNAGIYARSLLAIDPNLKISVVEPYAAGFDLQAFLPDAFDGIVFTGSNVPWSVAAPDARPLRVTMETAFRSGTPVLGSCNGMQMAALLLGGEVAESPNGMELGIARGITLTEEGRSHPLHSGRRPVFACPCVHRDEVRRLPDGAVLTAWNKHTPVQAMVYETGGVTYWGMQYHPEATLREFADLISLPGCIFAEGGDLVDDLRVADSAPQGDAARRLGASEDDLEPAMRSRELANWLSMLAT